MKMQKLESELATLYQAKCVKSLLTYVQGEISCNAESIVVWEGVSAIYLIDMFLGLPWGCPYRTRRCPYV